MTTFQDKQQSLAREPIGLLELTMDHCGLVFGQAPCTATGEPCYNTFPTCKDRAAYDRQTHVFQFCTSGSVPSFAGPRPYIKDSGVRMLPTEITDTLAVKGRVSVQMIDEPESSDVGLDPYADQRATIHASSYWRKWIARNAAYQGRPAVYLEGYAGLPRSEYRQRWKGQIDNIRLARGGCTLELVDPLKALDKIEIPAEIEAELVTPIAAGSTTATLTGDTDQIPDAGYLRVEDEIIGYTAISRGTNVISGITRGEFGTAAEDHDAETAVSVALAIGPINPYDLLKALFLNPTSPVDAYPGPPGAELPAESVDVEAFDYWRDYPGGEPDVIGLVEEPTELTDLVIEILQLLDASVWYSEDQAITIRRNLPNDPAAGFTVLTDDAHIVDSSGSVDLNDEERRTRVTLYWARRGTEDLEKEKSFRRIDQARDVSAESANEYGSVSEQKIMSRWLTIDNSVEEEVSDYAKSLTGRVLMRKRDANPIVTVDLDRKDSDIRTGDQIALTTDELLNPDGTPIVNVRGVVIKRDEPANGRIRITCELYTGPRYLVIAPDDFPDDWTDGNAAQQEYGCIAEEVTQGDGEAPPFALY